MTFALNELQGLVTKAVVGAGLPAGYAADLASAALWLAQRGFPACDILARALRSGNAGACLRHAADGLECSNARAAVDGPALIDHLIAADPGIRATLHGVDEPCLLLGLLGAAADAYQACFQIDVERTSLLVTPCADLAPADLTLTSPQNVTVARSNAPPSAEPPQLATRYDPAATGDNGWAELTRLATRTYVPASQQSRLTGAGAGLIDND